VWEYHQKMRFILCIWRQINIVVITGKSDVTVTKNKSSFLKKLVTSKFGYGSSPRLTFGYQCKFIRLFGYGGKLGIAVAFWR
jgi:hypothetical protein